MNELCLQQCLKLIEEKLGWGSSVDWLNQDFQLLSDRIFEETRIRLSITTLKRVWGKVNYDSAPSISTLNTLALFIGYDNWSAFKQNQNEIKKPRLPKTRKVSGKAAAITFIGLAVLVSLVIMAFNRNKEFPKISSETLAKVQFGSKPTSTGLPNSIIFTYDLADIETDSAFIQQSWDVHRTFQVDAKGKEATGIYYYPGYFKAKLIANNQILKEHDLHVKTDGWMGSIRQDGIPRYLYNEELNKEGKLSLSQAVFEEMHALDINTAKRINFHYSNDMGEVFGDNFIFETSFKNTYRKSNGICQFTDIMIHGSEGAFVVPFSIPGCVSDLEIFLLGKSVDGKTNDLSAFGSDFSEWQKLKCVGEGDIIKIYVNDKFAWEIQAPKPLGKIVGFRYGFRGAGEVDYVKLSDNKKVFFAEDF